MTSLVHAVQGMRNARHLRLVQWFEENTPASWDKKSEQFTQGKGKTAYNIPFIKSHPYWEKPEAIVEAYSLANAKQALKSLVSRARSPKASPEDRQALQEIANFIEGTPLAMVQQKIDSKVKGPSVQDVRNQDDHEEIRLQDEEIAA